MNCVATPTLLLTKMINLSRILLQLIVPTHTYIGSNKSHLQNRSNNYLVAHSFATFSFAVSQVVFAKEMTNQKKYGIFLR